MTSDFVYEFFKWNAKNIFLKCNFNVHVLPFFFVFINYVLQLFCACAIDTYSSIFSVYKV
jgi:hypothetical protein